MAPSAAAQGLDEVLDGIDDVLEINALTFVQSFRQKGNQWLAPAGRLHRAVGIETEYGVTSARLAPGGEGAPLSVDKAVQEVFQLRGGARQCWASG